MSEWDDFDIDARAGSVNRSPKCTVGMLLRTVGPDAVVKINAVMADERVTSRAIHRALAQRLEGHIPSIWTINRHRRADCSCEARRDRP